LKFYVKTKLSDNISETPEGFLLCRNVPLTHTGPLHYAKGEHPFEDTDEVVIKRDAKELFSPATIASFQGKDITIQHPDEFIAPDNYQELTNGVMFNIRKSKTTIDVEGETCEVLMCDFLIKTSEAIEMVKNGEREVSLGYEADWELISDEEGRHSNIRGNHCALVQAGRAGKHCAINDHKKEKTIMGLKELNEKFTKLFGKSVDEAMKEKEETEKAEDEDKDKLIKDLKAKISDMEKEGSKKSEDSDEEEKKEESKEESKDESDVESRLSKLEAMLEKLLSKMSGESEDEDDDKGEDIVADEDEECEDSMEGIEDEDEDEDDKKSEAKDSIMSRAEILAPGISKSKDMIKEALKKAYATADGKKIIDSLTSNKGIVNLSKDSEMVVFNAAAEALKTKRIGSFASQKILTIDSFPTLGKGSVSAEDINKKNKQHYGLN